MEKDNQSMSADRWDIMPYYGVGPLRFGLTRSEVRALLGAANSVFTKGPNATTETEAYDELGLHLYYDAEDRLECIEAWDVCPVFFENTPLLKGNVQAVLSDLAKAGLSVRYDNGYYFDDGGFALYAPDDVVQAVTVYRKGYYDDAPEEGVERETGT